MPKEKISATVDPVRLELARSLVDADTVSGLLDKALRALIDRERDDPGSLLIPTRTGKPTFCRPSHRT